MTQTLPRVGTQFCAKCETYLQQYECSVEKIYEVLCARFPSLWDKIESLRERQDARDHAIECYYSHKRSHRQRGERAKAA